MRFELKNLDYITPNTDYIFLNPYSYMVLRQSKELKNFKKCKIFFDGITLVWLSNIIGKKIVERVSFDDSSIAPTVFNHCVAKKLKLGIIGSKTETLLTVKKILEKKYKGLNIYYVHDGYFDDSHSVDIIKKASCCDVVICSMGSPKQEVFLKSLREFDWGGIGYTCGGYLDQLVEAKGRNYYPKWVDKLNLRWLYRIYKEPKRLIYRYLINYPKGIFLFLYDCCILKKNSIM